MRRAGGKGEPKPPMSPAKIIPIEEARALRKRIEHAIKSKQARPSQFVKILNRASFWKFRNAKQSITTDNAAKLTAFLDSFSREVPRTEAAPPAAELERTMQSEVPPPFSIVEVPSEPMAITEPPPAGYVSESERQEILDAVESARKEMGSYKALSKKIGVSDATLSIIKRRPITDGLAERIREGLASKGGGRGAPVSPTPRGSLLSLRGQARAVLQSRFSGQRPEFARAAGLTTRALSRFLDGASLDVEEANSVERVIASAPQSAKATAEPDSLDELIATFQRMAFHFVIKQAMKKGA